LQQIHATGVIKQIKKDKFINAGLILLYTN